jgi:DNA replication licensing factor MCM4
LAAEQDGNGKSTIIEKLVQSFSPSIYEEDEVKKGLLCQLFGGTPKPVSKTTRGKCRPEINTLLCGDPSTAKSQLLQYAYKLAPRGMYTSGKGSSAVGLTATISKDPMTGEIVLESGALVLSDRGLCCIDEFDKMDDNARSILHEAMEQQTVSVAKAGIVCSLNARTAILATANPKDSSYDPKKSVVDNINMPKNLMSRFDFIWLMLDKRNRDMDKRLADHLVSMYSESGVKKRIDAKIDPELFRRYVAFAKRWVHPEISEEAAQSLVKSYTDLRNQGGSREVITATPRILESLIRIAESLAKMELREVVTEADVEEAVRLLKAATYAAAIDPETGLIDMEQLIAGVGAGKRKRAKELESLLEEVLAEKAKSDEMLTVDQVRAAANEKLGEKKEQIMNEFEFNNAMKAIESDGRFVRRGRQIEVR